MENRTDYNIVFAEKPRQEVAHKIPRIPQTEEPFHEVSGGIKALLGYL